MAKFLKSGKVGTYHLQTSPSLQALFDWIEKKDCDYDYGYDWNRDIELDATVKTNTMTC